MEWVIRYWCVSRRRLVTDRKRIAALVNWVTAASAESVRPIVVLDEGVPGAAGLGEGTLVDFKGQVRRKLGAVHGSLLLARPDGYLSTHLRSEPPFDIQPLASALGPWTVLTSIKEQGELINR